jgi:nucleotide-binding universal stress UspA family protein
VVTDELLRYDTREGPLAAAVTEGATRALQRYTAALPTKVKERIRTEVVIGKAWREVLALADQQDVDLIVIGLHHLQPLRDVVLGTTAERIVRKSTRPVLVVKGKAMAPYRRVVAATDFSACSAHALKVGLEVAPDAAFTLLNVYETPLPSFIRFTPDQLADYTRPLMERACQEAEETMAEFLKAHASKGASIVPMLERDDVVPGIARVAWEREADLLVVGTHGRGGIATVLIGSVALSLLNDPPCDLLVSR